MKTTAIFLTLTLALGAFLLPVASANDSTVCLPGGGPVGGCASVGIDPRAVYYPDAEVTNWQMYCVWVACVMRPYPTTSWEYLGDAPVPYATAYVCFKTSCTNKVDTRDIMDVTLLA